MALLLILTMHCCWPPVGAWKPNWNRRHDVVNALETAADTTRHTSSKEGRFLSLFTIVKFQNGPCTGDSTNRGGTCYPYANCVAKSGVTDGACALGKCKAR